VIQEGMRQTVLSGSSPVLQQAGFPVAAKSGTAEIGVRKGRVHSWMSGYFPYQSPKYAFVVVLENGPVDTVYGAGKTTRDILKWIADNRPQYAGMSKKAPVLEEIISTEPEAGMEEGVTPL
jgi:penicillin-binding protein 2